MDELSAAHIPVTSVDNGWEFNIDVEAQRRAYINNPSIKLPANAYVSPPALASDTCPMNYHNVTPDISPIYGVSLDHEACYGLAPFPPMHYSRWLSSKPGTLYVVKYRPSTH